MGDRTWMRIIIRPADEAAITEVLGGMEMRDELEDGSLLLDDSEMNYGAASARQLLAHRGVPFYGRHGEGGEYGGTAFASTGAGIMYEWQVDHDGAPTLSIDPCGNVTGGDDLTDLREFLWKQAQAEAIVTGALPIEECADSAPQRKLCKCGCPRFTHTEPRWDAGKLQGEARNRCCNAMICGCKSFRAERKAPEPCAECHGEGRNDNPRGLLGTETCPSCSGTGKVAP